MACEQAQIGAASLGNLSVQAILALVLAALLMLRFNRPLARAHAALFVGSRAAPRWWQMALLRVVWCTAGAAILALMVFAVIEIVGS